MHAQHTSNTVDLNELEQLLARKPASPRFVMLADEYLAQHRPAQALKLCLGGLKHHPNHPTALLLIARAQVMLRQYNDARETLRSLLRRVPGSRAATFLLDRMTELELQYPPLHAASQDSEAFQDLERLGREQSSTSKWSKQHDILPPFDTEIHQSPRRERDAGTSARSELDLSTLASRLEGARIPSLSEVEHDSPSLLEEEESIDMVNLDSRPVTETLSEIYVQQGKIREAIDAYTRLAASRADKAEEYRARIAELKEKLAAE